MSGFWSCSRTSKAFSNKQTVKQCGCSEVYLDCLQTFLPALSCPLQKDILRSGVRTFLHRMIICLEEEVLPFIPSASEHMLKDCEAKDLQEFIPLINQITAKFKVTQTFRDRTLVPALPFSAGLKSDVCIRRYLFGLALFYCVLWRCSFTRGGQNHHLPRCFLIRGLH